MMLKKERPIIITLTIIILATLLYIILNLNKVTECHAPSNIHSEKGVLELSNWDFQKDGCISLIGQWEFYWQKLLTPEDFTTNPPVPSYIKMPMAWNRQNKNYAANGYATYKLTIKLNPKYKDTLLALSVPPTSSSYKLWVNGHLFSSNGIVGRDKVSEKPGAIPITSYFVNEGNTVDLVLQVSNHNFRNGGTRNKISLGTTFQMNKKREASIALEIFYFGVLLIMGLYHLWLYAFRIEDTSKLYFGALCIIISFRGLIVGDRYLLSLHHTIRYGPSLKLEYLTFYGAIYFMLSYIYAIFKEECSKKIINGLKLFCYFFMVTTILITPFLASKLIVIFEILALFIFIYCAFVILKAYGRKKQGTLLNTIVYLATFVISSISILHYVGVSSFNDNSLLGFFLLILLNAFTMARNQAKVYRKIENLSKEKEQYLLAEKLREVTFLLSSTLNLEEVLDKILKSLREIVPYDSASFFMEENNHLKVVAANGFKDMEAIFKLSINKKDDELFEEIYETNSTLLVSNVKEDPRFKHYVNLPNIESWMGIPIIFKNKILGILTLDSIEENIYSNYHCDIALSFAYHAGMAIENAKLYGKTKQLANIDPLTNLYNRRSFNELANISFDKAKALMQPISAIMIDIDNFKKINDNLGHHTGDLVLMRLSKVCLDNLSNDHILGRFGGEEFIVLLPNTSFEEAERIGERLRGAIANNPIIIRKSDSIPITASLGVASITPTVQDLDFLLIEADKCMYQAKASGKNKVIAINLDS